MVCSKEGKEKKNFFFLFFLSALPDSSVGITYDAGVKNIVEDTDVKGTAITTTIPTHPRERWMKKTCIFFICSTPGTASDAAKARAAVSHPPLTTPSLPALLAQPATQATKEGEKKLFFHVFFHVFFIFCLPSPLASVAVEDNNKDIYGDTGLRLSRLRTATRASDE